MYSARLIDFPGMVTRCLFAALTGTGESGRAGRAGRLTGDVPLAVVFAGTDGVRAANLRLEKIPHREGMVGIRRSGRLI